jgi:uncharacterized membrane protein
MDQANPSKPDKKSAIGLFDAHHRFMVACIVGFLAFVGLENHGIATRLVGSWDVFAFSVVTLAWMVLATQDPYEVRRNARFQDASGTFLFVLVVTAATASIFAVIILMGSAKDLSKTGFAAHIILSFGAIVLSWALVHTLFSLRYAHYYYIDAHKFERGEIEGGLVFPGDNNPDYLDFAYFSFVIGMTSQVSDVQISSKKMRRMATVHGILSFIFNTAILAMFVNIVASFI